MSQIVSLDSYRLGTAEEIAEANHRIANHLAMVVGLIQSQISEVMRGEALLAREEVRSLLREAASKVIAVAQLHRRLSVRGEYGEIDAAEFMIETVREIGNSLSLGNALSVCQRLSGDVMISAEQARTLALLVGEIVMNAVKHAHPTGIVTEISIACVKSKTGALQIEICDDGVGLPEGFEPAAEGGVGFRLIRTLAHTLNAALRIESDDLGLCFHLTIPDEKSSRV
ncbi:MAG: sensor histidine kinase [Rhizomicrobium sp.]|jgi:two-component sensor histidine kinase